MAVGRWVILFADNSVAFDSATAATIPSYMVNTFAQMAKVTAINGNTINLDRPMRWALGTNTQVWQSTSVPIRCGLENFTIENISGAGQNNIQFLGGQECWVRNVESKNAYKWHFRFLGLRAARRVNASPTALRPGGGGGDSVYGFGLFSRTGETLIEDNVAYHCRHSYITEYGCQGNVFGYNYSREPINENQLNTDYLMGDMIQHGGYPQWNLWEGNVAATIKFDYVLAGSRYLTAYRNQVQRKGLPSTIVANFQYDIQRQSYYVNLVGNVFEVPPATYRSAATRLGSTQDDESNPDAQVAATIYLHGNYDVPSGVTAWDAGNSDHTLPASLYLPGGGVSAPAFWDGSSWPAIGPETSAKTGGNPAFRRWQSGNSNPKPLVPQNLRIKSTLPLQPRLAPVERYTSIMARLIIEAGRTERQYWRDLWRYRELFYFLAWRDLLVRYKQTVVGVAWSLLRPLLTMLVLTLVFGKFGKMPSGGVPYPLLVFCGMLPWQFFANALSESGNSLVNNANLVSKVYFPRLVIPASSIITSFVDFLISAVFLVGLMIWYRFAPPPTVVFLPIFVLLALAASFGVGLWIAALMVEYRDFRFIVPFVVQFGLYLSAVGFLSSVVPDRFRLLYSLNPIVGVIDGFRWCLLGGQHTLYAPGLALTGIMVLVLILTGVWYFRRTERTFADVL